MYEFIMRHFHGSEIKERTKFGIILKLHLKYKIVALINTYY